MRTTSVRKIAGLALVAVLSACYEPKDFTVMRLMPSAIYLPNVQSIVVEEISAPKGPSVEHVLVDALMMQNTYQVLDGSTAWGLRWGRFDGQGADAVVTGAVQPTLVKRAFEAQAGRTANGADIVTYSRTVTVTVQGLFRIIDGHSGAILGVSQATGESTTDREYVSLYGQTSSLSEDELDAQFPAAPLYEMEQAAAEAMAQQFCQQIGRRYEPIQVTLYHDDAVPRLVDATSRAARGDWSLALQVYHEYLLQADRQRSTDAYKAHYNYGVALAMSGDLAHGMEQIRLADQHVHVPHIRAMLKMLEQEFHHHQLQQSGMMRQP